MQGSQPAPHHSPVGHGQPKVRTRGRAADFPRPSPRGSLPCAKAARPPYRTGPDGAHAELAPEAIYVGHLSVGVPILPGTGEGDADSIADRWYQLTQARDTFETSIGF
ncbi:hypothetical protein QF048_000237 [Streptomyces sp. W4I9-2]|nr:hypothetical protein [Streptomyces sp. W4I9-2]